MGWHARRSVDCRGARQLKRPLLLAANVGALILLWIAVNQPSEPVWNLSPKPDPLEQARDSERYAQVEPGGFIGAKISASENQLSTDEPLAFDRAKFDTSDLWNPDKPTRLTVSDDGFYRITTQLTILGSGYEGSPPSPNVGLEVIRNGDPTDFVCVDRLTNQDPTVALHLSCETTDWFLEADYVEVKVTPNRTVESNWPGRGNVSPLLIVERLD